MNALDPEGFFDRITKIDPAQGIEEGSSIIYFNPPTPIEQSDPELADHLRAIANGRHPVVTGFEAGPRGVWCKRRRGPYDPCGCGSGKKRKFCCGR